jgi:hypothetical protein
LNRRTRATIEINRLVDTNKQEDFSWQVALDRLAPIETTCGRDLVKRVDWQQRYTHCRALRGQRSGALNGFDGVRLPDGKTVNEADEEERVYRSDAHDPHPSAKRSAKR